jgi:hypothetical protein
MVFTLSSDFVLEPGDEVLRLAFFFWCGGFVVFAGGFAKSECFLVVFCW